VQGERIVAVASPGTLSSDGARIVDAAGKIVVPGGIEAHAHIGFGQGRPPWGQTTVVDFANTPDEGDVVQAVQNHLAGWKEKAYTDYSAHCTFRGSATPGAISQIKDLITAGLPSIKIFTTTIVPPSPDRPFAKTDMGLLNAIMEQTANYGGIVAVHSEDDDIVQYNYSMAQERGLWDWHNMHLIHSNASEDLSFRRVTRLAEQTGAGMYFVHVSAKEGVNAIADARSRGLPIYGETLLLYCSFNAEDYKEHDGMKYHTYPSLKFEADRLRLWDGLLQGDLTFMATDSIATPYAQKIEGRTVADVTGGNIGIEIRMGVTYTEGVVKQGMSLERYVEITSTNVAKVLGFYPRKGAIAVGSDADITIIDPSVKRKLALDELHLQDYNSWEGWEVEGWPTTVLLRGKIMIEDGKLLGQPTDGRLIPRKVDSSILQKPVV
jgi:dihydropyrimidinase